ncbi:MAG TPA: hypothetical protein DEP87_01395 [Candidatus Pacebacteria bacterium]|nr:hypothetical protein [Candidatus Paceibacterota bacterium]
MERHHRKNGENPVISKFGLARSEFADDYIQKLIAELTSIIDIFKSFNSEKIEPGQLTGIQIVIARLSLYLHFQEYKAAFQTQKLTLGVSVFDRTLKEKIGSENQVFYNWVESILNDTSFVQLVKQWQIGKLNPKKLPDFQKIGTFFCTPPDETDFIPSIENKTISGPMNYLLLLLSAKPTDFIKVKNLLNQQKSLKNNDASFSVIAPAELIQAFWHKFMIEIVKSESEFLPTCSKLIETIINSHEIVFFSESLSQSLTNLAESNQIQKVLGLSLHDWILALLDQFEQGKLNGEMIQILANIIHYVETTNIHGVEIPIISQSTFLRFFETYSQMRAICLDLWLEIHNSAIESPNLVKLFKDLLLGGGNASKYAQALLVLKKEFPLILNQIESTEQLNLDNLPTKTVTVVAAEIKSNQNFFLKNHFLELVFRVEKISNQTFIFRCAAKFKPNIKTYSKQAEQTLNFTVVVNEGEIELIPQLAQLEMMPSDIGDFDEQLIQASLKELWLVVLNTYSDLISNQRPKTQILDGRSDHVSRYTPQKSPSASAGRPKVFSTPTSTPTPSSAPSYQPVVKEGQKTFKTFEIILPPETKIDSLEIDKAFDLSREEIIEIIRKRIETWNSVPSSRNFETLVDADGIAKLKLNIKGKPARVMLKKTDVITANQSKKTGYQIIAILYRGGRGGENGIYQKY